MKFTKSWIVLTSIIAATSAGPAQAKVHQGAFWSSGIDNVKKMFTGDYNPFSGNESTPELTKDDATPKELRDTILGFEVSVNNGSLSGRNGARATLAVSGKIFRKCIDSYGASPQIIPVPIESDDGRRGISLRFRDPSGKLRVCMNEMKSYGLSCSSDQQCVELSSVSGIGSTEIDLSEYDSHTITANVGGKLLNFDPPIEYRDVSERVQASRVRQQNTAAAERAPMIRRYQEVLESCATTVQESDRKERALERLAAIPGALMDGDWSMHKEKIDLERLEVLRNLVDTTSVRDLPSIEEEISGLESRNPELAADIYLKMAEKYRTSGDMVGVSRAIHMLERVKGTGASPATAAKAEIGIWELKFAQLQTRATDGKVAPNPMYDGRYRDMMYRLSKRRMEACGNGIFASVELCNATTEYLQRMQREIPMDAMQGAQNRQQLQMFNRFPNSVMATPAAMPMFIPASRLGYPYPYMSYPMYSTPLMQPMGIGMTPLTRGF